MQLDRDGSPSAFESDEQWIERETERFRNFSVEERWQRIYATTFPKLQPDDIDWIADRLRGKSILEVGAGSGYLAKQLADRGLSPIATDIAPGEKNNYPWSLHHFDVIEMPAADAIDAHPEIDAVICSWPSLNGEWAADAIARIRPGCLFLYIGTGRGDCCATDEFFHILDRDFDELGFCESYEPGLFDNDAIVLFRRKQNG